jgi:hypothetical protein
MAPTFIDAIYSVERWGKQRSTSDINICDGEGLLTRLIIFLFALAMGSSAWRATILVKPAAGVSHD